MSLVRLYGGPADQEVVDVHDDVNTILVSPRPKPLELQPHNVSRVYRAAMPIYRYRRDTNNPEYAEYIQDFDR